LRRASFTGTKFGGGESEGGAGIHFPQPPFSSRPARAVRNFVQKRFELRSAIATNQKTLSVSEGFFDGPVFREGSSGSLVQVGI